MESTLGMTVVSKPASQAVYGNSGTRCVICGEAKTQTCAQCKSIRYCSTTCQTQDWPEHKLFCNQKRNLAPRPSPRHILSLYFPVSQSQPRLLWTPGQPPGSVLPYLNPAHVCALVAQEWSNDHFSQRGSPALSCEAAAHLVVHHTVEPASPVRVNASLKAWVGEGNDLRHIAPGPLLVCGHNGGEDKDVDHLRDFEMKDLKVLKALLGRPREEELERLTQGGTDLRCWFRM